MNDHAIALALPRDPKTATISCVVPAYNEAANLPRLLEVLTAQLRALVPRWEVVIVDDGSRDDSATAVAPWLATPGVRLLRLSRNFGKEAALSAGIDHARGDLVVLMDADLQHPPAMIEAMLQAWAGGADMVCARRRNRADEPWLKRLGTWLFYRVVNAGSSVPIPADAGDFRLMDRRVVDALAGLPERNRFLKGLYAWVGFRTEFIEYLPAERHEGASSFSLRRLFALALTGVTSFSNLPLRVWSGLGALVALGALGYGLFVVVDHFIEGSDVPGWATLVAGMMFFSGVQLLSIGILGEYVGRIFDEVKKRPVYLVGEDRGRGLDEKAN
ncbi:MAG: glycosyltransferase family 2 protein [Burkholderiales bacterium]|nr:glycosyltransferase family 2 protein [Burkholderiales bacterium]MDE2454894.1 glycosyltransferase family 2 protein [Burkholderiales bacterium]